MFNWITNNEFLVDATGQKLQACKGDEGELGCKASTTSVAGTACLCDSDG